MELAQAKIPYLPPDWTLARLARYAAKLGIFILVPGLHQIACKRRILGGLLLVLYFAAEFTLSNKPFEYSTEYFPTHFHASNLAEIFRNISWLLLALDLRKLETRKLKINFFLVLSCAAGIYFVPQHQPRAIYGYVEKENFACPAFCKYDFIEYELYPRRRRLEKELEGDYVTLGGIMEPYYTSRILAGPLKDHLIGTVKEACAGHGDKTELQRAKKLDCEGEINEHQNDYLTLGGPKPDFKNKNGKDVSFISASKVSGIRLKKIGNTHEYFIFSNEITDIVGNALLTVYKWTGINLFGLSERPKLD